VQRGAAAAYLHRVVEEGGKERLVPFGEARGPLLFVEERLRHTRGAQPGPGTPQPVSQMLELSAPGWQSAFTGSLASARHSR